MKNIRRALMAVFRSIRWSNLLLYKIKNKQFVAESKERLKSNAQFFKMHQGERCFIIGNGPSVKKVDLAVLADEITFTVNNFPRCEGYSKLRTTYHAWMDERFFDIDLSRPEDVELLATMRAVNSEGNRPTVFYRASAYDLIKEHRLDEELNVYYIEDLYLPNWEKTLNEVDFTQLVPKFSTVVQYLICMAVYMGFSEIYLLGCDCTGFITTAQAKMKTLDSQIQYAYTVSENEKKRMEHSNAAHSIQNELRWYADLFDEYEVLKRYCERKNVKLVNLTEGGLLEALERDALENILEKQPTGARP